MNAYDQMLGAQGVNINATKGDIKEIINRLSVIDSRLSRIETFVNPNAEPALLDAIEKAEKEIAAAKAFFEARTGDAKQ